MGHRSQPETPVASAAGLEVAVVLDGLLVMVVVVVVEPAPTEAAIAVEAAAVEAGVGSAVVGPVVVEADRQERLRLSSVQVAA